MSKSKVSYNCEQVTILGIRHHGPGSSKAVLERLQAINPATVLLEGPPEGNSLLSFVTDIEMKPPVSLLVYDISQPKTAWFYPFADFSPEWVAAVWGLKNHQRTVQFIDLPVAVGLAMEAGKNDLTDNSPTTDSSDDSESVTDANDENKEKLDIATSSSDTISSSEFESSLSTFARLAGYPYFEAAWDALIEGSNIEASQLFATISELMQELRASEENSELSVATAIETSANLDQLREAAMRENIRTAVKNSSDPVVVICGAWHVPALQHWTNTDLAKIDVKILKKLPTVKTATAWTPWSGERLAKVSAYGAGINSPE